MFRLVSAFGTREELFVAVGPCNGEELSVVFAPKALPLTPDVRQIIRLLSHPVSHWVPRRFYLTQNRRKIFRRLCVGFVL